MMNLSHSERSVFIERPDARYHVRIVGEGNPVVLLHGFTGSSASWDHLIPDLSSRFTLICPDLLGHGLSDAPVQAYLYEMPEVAADLIAILDDMGIHRAGLHGYSMGGRLALYAALQFPDRFASLSLESASPGLAYAADRATRKSSDDDLADRILRNGINAFVKEWDNLPLFKTLSAGSRDTLHHQRLKNSPLGLANNLRGMGTGVQPSLWGRLGELKTPVLLINGMLDAKFDAIAAQMAEHIPGARRSRFENCGHVLHHENVARWLLEILAFHTASQP